MDLQLQEDVQQGLSPTRGGSQQNVPQFNTDPPKKHVPVVDIESFEKVYVSPSRNTRKQNQTQNQKTPPSQNARSLRSRDGNGKVARSSEKRSPSQQSTSKSKKSNIKEDCIRVTHRSIGKSNNRSTQGNNKKTQGKDSGKKESQMIGRTTGGTQKNIQREPTKNNLNKDVQKENEPKKSTRKEHESVGKKEELFNEVPPVNMKNLLEVLPESAIIISLPSADLCISDPEEMLIDSVPTENPTDSTIPLMVVGVTNHVTPMKILETATVMMDNTTVDTKTNVEIVTSSATLALQNGVSNVRKYYSIEADLGIRPTPTKVNSPEIRRCSSPITTTSQLGKSPNHQKSPTADYKQSKDMNKCLDLLREIERNVMKKRKAEYDSKKKYKMFLPDAFSDTNFTESIVHSLYGRFNVTKVVAHYTEKGERMGSGTMVVTEDCTEGVKNHVPERFWRAVRMVPLKRRESRSSSDIVKMYFEFGVHPNWTDEKIKTKLEKEFQVSDFQIIYDAYGQWTKSAISTMPLSTAESIDRMVRCNEVFEPRLSAMMLEVVDANILNYSQR